MSRKHGGPVAARSERHTCSCGVSCNIARRCGLCECCRVCRGRRKDAKPGSLFSTAFRKTPSVALSLSLPTVHDRGGQFGSHAFIYAHWAFKFQVSRCSITSLTPPGRSNLNLISLMYVLWAFHSHHKRNNSFGADRAGEPSSACQDHEHLTASSATGACRSPSPHSCCACRLPRMPAVYLR